MKFEQQFRERYPTFLQELARSYPMLSRTELEICAMLREAMPSWQIAEILGITERSVENHRSNIRHKLRLSSHQGLHNFLVGALAAAGPPIATQS